MTRFEEALLQLRHDELKERQRAGAQRYRHEAARAARPHPAPPHHRALAWLGRWLVVCGAQLQARYAAPPVRRDPRRAGG